MVNGRDFKELVQRSFEAVSDTPALFAELFDACADSLVFEVAPTHETLRWLRWEGRENVRQFLVAAFEHARDLRYVTNDVVADGDVIVYQATEVATLTEALHGFPAGSRTEQEQTHLFRIRDGRIVSWKMFPGPHLAEGTSDGSDI